jgi:hypothetical protein
MFHNRRCTVTSKSLHKIQCESKKESATFKCQVPSALLLAISLLQYPQNLPRQSKELLRTKWPTRRTTKLGFVAYVMSAVRSKNTEGMALNCQSTLTAHQELCQRAGELTRSCRVDTCCGCQWDVELPSSCETDSSFSRATQFFKCLSK